MEVESEIAALRSEVAQLQQMLMSIADNNQMMGGALPAVQLNGCGGENPRCFDISSEEGEEGNLINCYIIAGGIPHCIDEWTLNVYQHPGKIIAVTVRTDYDVTINTYNSMSQIDTTASSEGWTIYPLYKMATLEQGETIPKVELDFRTMPILDTWSLFSS